jgi:drug/metabolite transporter (DMT)-like permease
VNVRSGARLRGAALVALAAVCFGTLGPLTRFGAANGIDPLPLVTWRAGLGATLVLVVVAARAARGRTSFVPFGAVARREWALQAIGIGSGATLNFALFLAFARISIALALLVFYSYPALVSAISALRFGEPFDRFRVVALGATLGGLVLVLAGAGGVGALDPLGVGLAFLAGLAQMFYVLAARHGFPNVPTLQAASITMGGGALLYVILGAVIGTLPGIAEPLASPTALGIALFTGFIGAGIPTLAFIGGIRLLGPPRAAILSTLEPVVGVALAALLLGEVPGALQAFGGALVIAGGALAQLGPEASPAEHEAVAPEPGDEI